MSLGYKKTNFGLVYSLKEIPNNWNTGRLNEVTTQITDGTHFTPTYKTFGVPFIRVTDLKNSDLLSGAIKYVSEVEHKELIKRCNPKKGDILYSKNGTIGITRIIDWDWEFSIFVSICLIKPNLNLIQPIFLKQYLSSEIVKEQIRIRAKQGAITNLHLEEIRDFFIPLPPLPEQQKIAEILSTVDDKIEVIDQQIIETQALKKGLMQRLLTKGIGHIEFKDSPLGMIPESWEVVKQAEVATFYNGRAYKLTEWEKEGTPVIRLQNLTGTGKNYYYSNLSLPEHQYCYKGDLLYMWSATFGPVWWFGDKAIFHYHIWKIEHDSKFLDKNFHYYLLDNVTTRMKNESHGSTMLHVTKGGMEKLLIQLPPLAEQQKIAEILSSVEDKLEVLSLKKTHYQELKQGLMQQLLTGKIRVKA